MSLTQEQQMRLMRLTALQDYLRNNYLIPGTASFRTEGPITYVDVMNYTPLSR